MVEERQDQAPNAGSDNEATDDDECEDEAVNLTDEVMNGKHHLE